MDQAAIDEVAENVSESPADRRAPGPVAGASQAQGLRQFLRRDGGGRHAGRRAHPRNQDRRQARRRGGLRAVRGGRVFISPARVPRALSPCQYIECEISFRLTRDLPARQPEYAERRCTTRWKPAPRSNWSTAASAISNRR